MSGIYKGAVGFNWLSALGSTSLSGSGAAIQSAKHKRKSDIFAGRNSDGTVIGRNHYNPEETITIEYLVTGASLNGSASIQMPNCGDDFNITDATMPSLTGTWDIDGAESNRTNTNGAVVSVDLYRNPNVG